MGGELGWFQYCECLSAKWVAVSTATPNIEISSLNFDPNICSRQSQGKGTSTLRGLVIWQLADIKDTSIGPIGYLP